MRATTKRSALVLAALALTGTCLLAGAGMLQGQAIGQDAAIQQAQAPSEGESGEGSASEWKTRYPAQYYSFAGGADDMDDMGGYITDTGNTHSHATLFANMGPFAKSTCISCKSVAFNDWYDEYGYDVFYERYNEDTGDRWAQLLQGEDVWSCDTCHADIDNPTESVGAQIMTFETFGGDLLDQLDPQTAACGQCHNGLGPWNNLRILDGVDLSTTEVSAYRYGCDPGALLKATLEDATPTSESPNGKTYSPTTGSHAQCDEELDIYRIDNGGHFDVEIFQGSVMQQAGLTCTSCHMPQVTTVSGETYTSHDASGSPLDSYAALTGCLDCHKNQGIETQEDMVQFVRDKQQELADRDAEVAAKQDEVYEILRTAILSGDFDEETLDEARYDYAAAAYYKEYVFNEAEKAGEKVAHNPDMSFKYLDTAMALLEDAVALLS